MMSARFEMSEPFFRIIAIAQRHRRRRRVPVLWAAMKATGLLTWSVLAWMMTATSFVVGVGTKISDCITAPILSLLVSIATKAAMITRGGDTESDSSDSDGIDDPSVPNPSARFCPCVNLKRKSSVMCPCALLLGLESRLFLCPS